MKQIKKVCVECNKKKKLDQFYESRLSEDGLFDKCVCCCKVSSKALPSREQQLMWYTHYLSAEIGE